MYIDFARFIQESTIVNKSAQYHVIYFVTSEYPSLFFAQLREIIQANSTTETIDVSQETHNECMARLSTSFLGTKLYVILRGLDDIPATKQELFLRFLGTYEGPHTLILAVSSDIYNNQKKQYTQVHQSSIAIEISDKVNEALFIDIIKWTGLPLNVNIKKVSGRLFDRQKYISLEQTCALIRYMRFGMHDQVLLEELFSTLIVPEQSLFTLSQYFFQKNIPQFLVLWRQLQSIYATAFWISYWSDQLWRASLFVYFSKAGNHTEARKIAFRLPFSFTNKDWRNYIVSELTAAHDFLYKLDYRIKNSEALVGLDLFYITFLLNQFHAPINSARENGRADADRDRLRLL